MTDAAGDPRTVPTGWQRAVVQTITPETSRASTFRLHLERPSLHRAGQHYVVRLTAPDGYTASRSYSVASAPDGSADIDLTVERLEGGEVSGFLHDDLQTGDEIEVRGPIGGWFVWGADAPALLIGGGSGVVPLMAMLRLGRARGRSDLVRLLVSVRSPEDLYYRDEIVGPETTILYTRSAPSGDRRAAARLQAGDLPTIDASTTCFVCGSAGFAEAASQLLVQAGVTTDRIRVERFGPTA